MRTRTHRRSSRASALRVLALQIAVAAASAQSGRVLPDLPVEIRREPAAAGTAPMAALVVAADVYGHDPTWALPSAKVSGELVRKALVAAGAPAPAVRLLQGRDVHAASVRNEILAASDRLRAGDGAVLLAFWIGHGWVHDGEQQLFEFFTEEQGETFANTVSVRQLVRWLDEGCVRAAARGVQATPVLVVDACRVAKAAPPPRARLVASSAWQVFSVKEGRFAVAGPADGAFPFAQAFANALSVLAARAETVRLDAVFREARDRTLRATAQRQEPEMHAPAGRDPRVAPAIATLRKVGFSLCVLDGLDGARIERSLLRFAGVDRTLTDARAQLDASPGEHALEIAAEGYLRRHDVLVVDDALAGAEVVVRLLPALTIVRGRVTPPQTVDAEVRGVSGARANYHVLRGSTDAAGRFELRLPAAGPDAKLVLARGGDVLNEHLLAASAAVDWSDPARQHTGARVIELDIALAVAALEVPALEVPALEVPAGPAAAPAVPPRPPAAASGDAEPNDSEAEAIPVTIGETRRGQVSTADTLDIYRLVAPGVGLVRVRMHNRNGRNEQGMLDPCKVRTAAGTVASGRAGPGRDTETKRVRVAAGEECFVEVRCARRSNPVTYDIEVLFEAQADTGDPEPNDDEASAIGVAAGEARSGVVSKDDRRDVYRLVVPADGLVSARMTNTNTTGQPSMLDNCVIRSANGKVVSGRAHQGAATETKMLAVRAGEECFIEVNAAGASLPASYRLEIRFTPK